MRLAFDRILQFMQQIFSTRRPTSRPRYGSRWSDCAGRYRPAPAPQRRQATVPFPVLFLSELQSSCTAIRERF